MSMLPPSPFLESALERVIAADAAAGPEFADPPVPAAVIFSEPSMTNGGEPGAPASAPTKNPDAGVLCNCEYAHCDDFDRPDCKAKAAGLDPWPDGATDHIHELFFYARKLSAEARTFIPDYPAIYQAMLDPNAPRALETDPVWADEAPLFLQKREA